MRYVRLGAVALVLVLLGPALAETGVTEAHREIRRLVATPGPVGPVAALSDQHAWRVDVPTHGVVEVSAIGSGTSAFFLRANRTLSGLWLAGTASSVVLDEPGAWRVEVDPVAGAAVEIAVSFRGFVAGQGGVPTVFDIEDAQADRGCIAAGVCLP